jgi:type IV secretion system protein VirB2
MRQARFAAVILILFLTVAPQAAWAQGGTLQPAQSMFQTLVQTLTGPLATSLATLAVIISGFLAFIGRFTWNVAGYIILGIILVFGSIQIVQFLQSAVGR